MSGCVFDRHTWFPFKSLSSSYHAYHSACLQCTVALYHSLVPQTWHNAQEHSQWQHLQCMQSQKLQHDSYTVTPLGAAALTFQPFLPSWASTRLASFLYSTNTITRFLRDLWYFCSSSSMRWSRRWGSITSTTWTHNPKIHGYQTPLQFCFQDSWQSHGSSNDRALYSTHYIQHSVVTLVANTLYPTLVVTLVANTLY